MIQLKKFQEGFTLIEVLIAIVISGVLMTATLQFYISQHNNMLVQHDISDMQQNLRACVDELSLNLRNAGSNLPSNMLSIEGSDGNPDSLTVRYSTIGGNVNVANQTQTIQASPIHVDINADVSSFKTGMTVFLWHEGLQTGEWFTITNVAINIGSGWQEIHHLGQTLLFDPMPGDKIIVLEESTYFINSADTATPLFMKISNGGIPQIYAENINDFQLKFTLSDGTIVDTVGITDTVLVINVDLSAHTASVDIELADRTADGRRHRSLSTDILIRNNRF